MYRIDPERADLAREFKASPLGPHSPELQRLLQRLRWGNVRGKTVILCARPYREWRLAKLGPARGTAMQVDDSAAFVSYSEAVWACFRARWKETTGTDCPVE